MGDTMETLISYRTPGDLFNPEKRPPGHVLDPIIRSAVRTASATLEELGVPHRAEYIDGRDSRNHTSGTEKFYGALIILAGPGQEPVPIPYGWAQEDPAQDGAAPSWKNLHTCPAGCGQSPDQSPDQNTCQNPGEDCTAAASVVQTVVRTWEEMGLVSTLYSAPGAEGEPA